MKYTSAEAAKLLRKLNEEYQALIDREQKSAIFTAAVDEKLEDVRPAYDFAGTNTKLQELQPEFPPSLGHDLVYPATQENPFSSGHV